MSLQPSNKEETIIGTRDLSPLVSIIIPTYNEAENISELLERIDAVINSHYQYEVIIVDDNSPDGTAKIAQKFSEKFPVRVVIRQRRMGLASAVVEGFKHALGKYVVAMDADLQHPPEVIPSLVSKLEKGYQVAIASRYVKGGGVNNFPYIRRIISRGATILSWILLPRTRGLKDTMSGFFAIRREFILSETRLRGYKLLLEILVRYCPTRVVEVPYIFQDRKRGKSKMSLKEIFNYIRDLYWLRRTYGNCNKY